MKAYLLKAHRWTALLFALPLLVVVVTGFILSFEPILETASVKPGSVSADQLTALVAKYDPAGKARGLIIDPRLHILTLQGVGADGSTDVDLSSGAEAGAHGALRDFFLANRRLHRSLVFQMNWLVVASSYAMLALAALGLCMGFSRLRASLAGWHKGVAWALLPLVALSPLTGIIPADAVVRSARRLSRRRRCWPRRSIPAPSSRSATAAAAWWRGLSGTAKPTPTP